jgi:hypothetical protein
MLPRMPITSYLHNTHGHQHLLAHKHCTCMPILCPEIPTILCCTQSDMLFPEYCAAQSLCMYCTSFLWSCCCANARGLWGYACRECHAEPGEHLCHPAMEIKRTDSVPVRARQCMVMCHPISKACAILCVMTSQEGPQKGNYWSSIKAQKQYARARILVSLHFLGPIKIYISHWQGAKNWDESRDMQHAHSSNLRPVIEHCIKTFIIFFNYLCDMSMTCRAHPWSCVITCVRHADHLHGHMQRHARMPSHTSWVTHAKSH